MFLLTLLLAPYLRKFGRYTVPDFIGDRYYSNGTRAVQPYADHLYFFNLCAGQMRGVGVVFSRYLQVDIFVGVAIGVGVNRSFCDYRRVKGITWTQVAQIRF